MRSAWVSVGEQMATASTSLEARIASISATLAPVAFAKAAPAAGSASATRVTSLSERAATLPPWIFPIRPAPIIPNFMGSSSKRPNPSGRSKKECTFHIDLGIEFLFHSDDAERRRQAGHPPHALRREALGENAHGQYLRAPGRRVCAFGLSRAGSSERQGRDRHRRHARFGRGDRAVIRRTRRGGTRDLWSERRKGRASRDRNFGGRLSNSLRPGGSQEGRRLSQS